MPSKHTLSPVRESPPKRPKLPHVASSHSRLSAYRRSHPLTLDGRSLSDELFLIIMSYLTPWELSSLERVDRHFMRLANDSQLWKQLYLRAHPSPTLRGAGAWPIARHLVDPAHQYHGPDRTTIPLPARAFQASPMNWKQMFRVSTNWSQGRSTLRPIQTSISHPSPSSSAAPSRHTLPLTAFSPSSPYIFTSSRETVAAPGVPLVHVHSSATQLPSSIASLTSSEPILSFFSTGLAAERSSEHVRGRLSILDISVDGQGSTSPLTTRVHVAYSSGSFSVFSIAPKQLKAMTSSNLSLEATELFYQPSPTVPPLQPTVLSALYSDFLVTCSSCFWLSFYHLPLSRPSREQTTAIQPFKGCRSYVSWFPAALSVTSSSSGHHSTELTVSLAYSVPVYPDSFACALQLFTFESLSDFDDPKRTRWHLTADRHLSALPSVPFSSPTASPKRVSLEGEFGLVDRCTCIAMDERWVCLGGGDNRVQIYQIAKDDRMIGGLVFVRTLWCHQGGITALSCLDGRLISADSMGRTFITELDEPFCLPSSDSPSLSPIDSTDSNPIPLSIKTPSSSSPSRSRSPSPSLSGLVNTEVLPPSVHRQRRMERAGLSGGELDVGKVSEEGNPGGSADWESDGYGDDARGREEVVWLSQDATRIVSVSVPRGRGRRGYGSSWNRDDGGGESMGPDEPLWTDRMKVWAFDT